MWCWCAGGEWRKTGFAYSDQIDLVSIQQCADAVKGIAQSKQGNRIVPQGFHQVDPILRYQAINPLNSLSKEKKIALLYLVDKNRTRGRSPSDACFCQFKRGV